MRAEMLARFLRYPYCTRRDKRPGAQAGNGTGASHVHCGGAPGPVVGGLSAPFFCPGFGEPKEKARQCRAFAWVPTSGGAGTGGIQISPPDVDMKRCHSNSRQKATLPVNDNAACGVTAGKAMVRAPGSAPGHGFPAAAANCAQPDGSARPAMGWAGISAPGPGYRTDACEHPDC